MSGTPDSTVHKIFQKLHQVAFSETICSGGLVEGGGCSTSQVKMAEKLGLDRSYLADVERGKRNISVLNLEVIAQGLGLSLSQLFSKL